MYIFKEMSKYLLNICSVQVRICSIEFKICSNHLDNGHMFKYLKICLNRQ